ncbi:Uma2 family endonuclease [Nitratifractor salsuginis]|uniref:Putative restriction endonuclease domain-containing protein n=1 Tax=Nitratifractor salsuginis (strain DSM 16511 / JCM 12458 / E9I37-1) TaxID=749222 RepID=E6WZ59_NITSE|nr:Uma2 family endonuclease [Nitratifractor salsuginis]ADV45509.1 protein of unknown function DUF820 [Nitratifractor salsuginis DSM 16511]
MNLEALKLYEHLPNYTYDDYKKWEGDWELIAGVPYAMAPAPVKLHQKLVGMIFAQIESSLEKCSECEALIDSDWKIDSQTVLKPDVALVCGDENPDFISKTPELIFEVLSPSTAKRDEGLKFSIYEQEGVKYYVLVYPDALMARIYKNDNFRFVKMGECDTERFEFNDLRCPLSFDFDFLFKKFRR